MSFISGRGEGWVNYHCSFLTKQKVMKPFTYLTRNSDTIQVFLIEKIMSNLQLTIIRVQVQFCTKYQSFQISIPWEVSRIFNVILKLLRPGELVPRTIFFIFNVQSSNLIYSLLKNFM